MSNQQEMINRALKRATDAYLRHYENRRRRAIKVIDFQKPVVEREPPATSVSRKNICKAVLLSGEPCKYKATSPCGKFCRKHYVN